MAKSSQTKPDTNPDDLLNEGGAGLREPDEMPISPMGQKSSQKQRMGYNADNLQGGAKAQGLAGKAGGMSGGAGGIGGMSGGAKGAADPASMAADKLSKGLEKNKGDTEKKIDKAAGKATEAAVTAATGGAGTGTLATVAGKVVEKVGTKRIAVVAGVAIVAPIVVIGFFIAYLLNGGAWDALTHVLTDKKTREFILQVADNWSQDNGLVNVGVKIAEKFNDVVPIGYEGTNAAIAATRKPKPEPGSIEEKFEKVDWAKSQFQTLSKNDCRYDLQLQKVVNTEGKVRSIPKAVLDKQTGKTTPVDQLNSNTAAGYCIAQKYPIYNMLWRQPTAREINKKADISLNYAAPKDSPDVQGNNTEVDKYVYDKTLKRVTPKKDSTVNLDSYSPLLDNIAAQYQTNVDFYNKLYPDKKIDIPDPEKNKLSDDTSKMYQKMADGSSPYSQEMQVQNFFNIPSMETPTHNDVPSINVAGTGLASAICPLIYTFADIGPGALFPDDGAKNARAAIETRLGSAQRGSSKNLTLTDTRKADTLSSNEGNASIQQNDNWASSTAYQIDVNNQIKGVQMNPEGTHNRAYNAQQQLFYRDDVDPNSPLHRIKGACYVIGRRGTTINIGSEKDKVVDAQRGEQANGDMVVAFQDLKKQILAQSPGVYTNVDNFGIKEVMTVFIRTGSVSAVSGLEPGPDNYNRQAMGLRQQMNDYTLAIGGRFLTPTESKELAIRADNLDRTQQSENGIAYRLLNTTNIHSVASLFQQNTLTPNTTKTALIGSFKGLLDPLRSLADIHSNITFYTTGFRNKAFAADITGDQYFKIDTSGFTPQETALDPLENAHIIEAIKKDTSLDAEAKKKKFTNYDTCFKAKIPSSQYFDISIDSVGDPVTGYKQFFTFFPDKSRDLDTNKNAVGDTPDSEFNKFNDCKFILFDAKDLKNPEQLLAIRYRLYTYYNYQLDYLGKLSSDESDTSIYANSAGTGTGSSSSGGSIVSGNIKDLATQVIANTNITYDPGVKDQMQQIASGENPVKCGGKSPSEIVLGYILGLAKDHKLQISSFVRPGDDCSQSPHATGVAVDIDYYDGQALTGTNEPSKKLIQAAIDLIPADLEQTVGFGIGSGDKSGIDTKGKKIEFFSDNPNHVHTQFIKR
ncbi:hypothetical protein H0W80_03995 [Candidatus Saccharibacteria bacterium]|nr:hypothetical protein [Candidatus Saccharibacteria bacterium]